MSAFIKETVNHLNLPTAACEQRNVAALCWSQSRGDTEPGSEIQIKYRFVPALCLGEGWETNTRVPQEQNAQGSPSTRWEEQK